MKLRIDHLGWAARRQTPPPPMGQIHHHQEVELNFLFSGEITYVHRGTTRRLRPGQLSVFWGAVPHSLVRVAPRTDMAWITIPLVDVRASGLPGTFMRGLLQGDWIMAPRGSGDRFPVAEWVREFGRGGVSIEPGLRQEIFGCIWWLARHGSNAGKRAAPSQTTEGLQAVEKIVRIMAENYQEPLDVASIAAAANLHPNYAMNLFRRRCGLTIRDYLTQLRITHAQRRLLEGKTGITVIALESGFSSLSAFYDAFTRRVGTTPRAFRERFGATPR